MKKKKNFLIRFVVVTLFSVILNPIMAQSANDSLKIEITEALNSWNTACKSGDVEKLMNMFDDSEGIMLIGSARGEINKGKVDIKKWLGQLSSFAGFSWEMNRIDIDANNTTAWVFVDGKMIVNFHKGGQKITPYRFSAILIKKNAVWKWRQFDGSVPQSE
ncbi:MAG: nuclear transport factor 2 family protein [Paludibacter sp.]|jgi:ketosteroid isomerase-like protein